MHRAAVICTNKPTKQTCTDLTDGDDEVSTTVVIRKLLALFLSVGDEVLRIWIDLTPYKQRLVSTT